jgi:predicted RNA-binding protein with PUA-like domain
MAKAIWLLKTEPNEFSIDDLATCGDAGEPWNGIRNYQARNFLRDMKKGDLAFIYHSACAEPGIVGLCTIIKEDYPDVEALDSSSKYFDPKSSPDNIRWSLVDVKFKEKYANPLSLKAIKADPRLADMKLVRSARLSVSPVSEDEYQTILTLLMSL